MASDVMLMLMLIVGSDGGMVGNWIAIVAMVVTFPKLMKL